MGISCQEPAEKVDFWQKKKSCKSCHMTTELQLAIKTMWLLSCDHKGDAIRTLERFCHKKTLSAMCGNISASYLPPLFWKLQTWTSRYNFFLFFWAHTFGSDYCFAANWVFRYFDPFIFVSNNFLFCYFRYLMNAAELIISPQRHNNANAGEDSPESGLQ